MIEISEKAKKELIKVLEDKASIEHTVRVHVSGIG